MTESKTADDYCAALKMLEAKTLGPALLEHAYRIDVVRKRIVMQYEQKFDIELQFGGRFGGFHTCDYEGWQVCMEGEE